MEIKKIDYFMTKTGDIFFSTTINNYYKVVDMTTKFGVKPTLVLLGLNYTYYISGGKKIKTKDGKEYIVFNKYKYNTTDFKSFGIYTKETKEVKKVDNLDVLSLILETSETY